METVLLGSGLGLEARVYRKEMGRGLDIQRCYREERKGEKTKSTLISNSQTTERGNQSTITSIDQIEPPKTEIKGEPIRRKFVRIIVITGLCKGNN